MKTYTSLEVQALMARAWGEGWTARWQDMENIALSHARNLPTPAVIANPYRAALEQRSNDD